MKDLNIEHLVLHGFDRELNSYKFTAYCEKNSYQFLVELVKEGVSGKKWPIRNCSNEYVIRMGGHTIMQSVLSTVCSPTVYQAMCDYLHYDYEKFKNDIYASIDKKYFLDFLKNGISDYDVVLPVENILTPNTNWSDADTVLAVLDKEHNLIDDDDFDFLVSVFNRLLSYDKSYIKPFLVCLSDHLFSEFLSFSEKDEFEKSGRLFPSKPDNFTRSIKSYSDHLDFTYSYKNEDEDDEKSIEKFEFVIKRGFYDKS